MVEVNELGKNNFLKQKACGIQFKGR